MASAHSRVNGQPYPAYILQFGAGTDENPTEYSYNLVIQPDAPIDGTSDGDLSSDQLSVLEGLLEGIAAWLATQSNVQVATGTPDLTRVDEADTTLYSQA
jgi:hypothetical protein